MRITFSLPFRLESVWYLPLFPTPGLHQRCELLAAPPARRASATTLTRHQHLHGLSKTGSNRTGTWTGWNNRRVQQTGWWRLGRHAPALLAWQHTNNISHGTHTCTALCAPATAHVCRLPLNIAALLNALRPLFRTLGGRAHYATRAPHAALPSAHRLHAGWFSLVLGGGWYTGAVLGGDYGCDKRLRTFDDIFRLCSLSSDGEPMGRMTNLTQRLAWFAYACLYLWGWWVNLVSGLLADVRFVFNHRWRAMPYVLSARTAQAAMGTRKHLPLRGCCYAMPPCAGTLTTRAFALRTRTYPFAAHRCRTAVAAGTPRRRYLAHAHAGALRACVDFTWTRYRPW